jgi:hypothetical protein
MDYVIVITGLTDALSVHHIDDIIGDLKMYLDDEHVPYTDVLLEQRDHS